jgi:uncharacterized repeat protein (TIGR01451 family)
MKPIFLLFSILSIALFSEVGAQADQPVSVRLEIFVVSQVTNEDGSIKETFKPSQTARPGQTVEYRLFAKNEDASNLPAGTVVITGPIPEGTTFVPNATTPNSDEVLTEYSADGETFQDSDTPLMMEKDGKKEIVDPSAYKAVRWTLLKELQPEQEVQFVYRITVNPASN